MLSRSAKHLSCLILFVIVLSSVSATAQTTTPSSNAPPPAPQLVEIDSIVKIIGAAIAGVATLFGLPIVFLTYRKTRAEITKLELEASQLRGKQQTSASSELSYEKDIRVIIQDSSNAHVQILADPRFLAPLLILLDFIFAWSILILTEHFLSVFNFGILRAFGLTLLSAVLFLPIIRQVLRVRSVLRPPRTFEEVRASERRKRVVFYSVYAMGGILSLALGILALVILRKDLTELGKWLACGLIALGTTLLVSLPFATRLFERRIAKPPLRQEHIDNQPKSQVD
jgi:hypothetical protein